MNCKLAIHFKFDLLTDHSNDNATSPPIGDSTKRDHGESTQEDYSVDHGVNVADTAEAHLNSSSSAPSEAAVHRMYKTLTPNKNSAGTTESSVGVTSNSTMDTGIENAVGSTTRSYQNDPQRGADQKDYIL